jgi:hypothetical protein
MAKKSSTGSKRPARAKPPAPPPRKLFRPISWGKFDTGRPPGEFISHLLLELGRLGLEVRDIEDYDRPPNRTTVLSDLLEWMGSQPSKALAALNDWQRLDLVQLQSRSRSDRAFKPRIEISAQITKMNNLSVRWHPGGWRNSEIDWSRPNRNRFNLIESRKWREPPDFHWFEGNEDPYFDSRPSNELMYVRGVGNLKPEPSEGYYGFYNHDVVDSILICAVRSAYESFIQQLEFGFSVKVIDGFDFVIRDEMDESDASRWRAPTNCVVSWTLEDADDLNARREREAAEEQERKDRSQFDNLDEAFGFSVDRVVGAISRACAPKATGANPSLEIVDRNAAKELRTAGFKIDAGQLRRIRKLIERYRPDVLPEAIKMKPAREEAQTAPPPDNVVQFPDKTE